MIGLRPGSLALEDWSEDWAAAFREEESSLRRILGGLPVEIEHIGSTSIPGCAAKPIIDIGLGLGRSEDGERLVELLAGAGYVSRGEAGIPGRRYFVKRSGELVTHHLHAFDSGSREWRGHLAFRDFLRRRPGEAEAYSALKRRLAAEHPNDREGYTEAKTPYILGILAAAGVGPDKET